MLHIEILIYDKIILILIQFQCTIIELTIDNRSRISCLQKDTFRPHLQNSWEPPRDLGPLTVYIYRCLPTLLANRERTAASIVQWRRSAANCCTIACGGAADSRSPKTGSWALGSHASTNQTIGMQLHAHKYALISARNDSRELWRNRSLRVVVGEDEEVVKSDPFRLDNGGVLFASVFFYWIQFFSMMNTLIVLIIDDKQHFFKLIKFSHKTDREVVVCRIRYVMKMLFFLENLT